MENNMDNNAIEQFLSAREMTRKDIVKESGFRHTRVEEIENNTNQYITILRHLIEGLGGELEIIAHMPSGDVLITNFDNFEPEEECCQQPSLR